MTGDEEAFAALARASADRLLAISYRILRDVGRAEDAVQQTLVTAWRTLPGLRDPDRFDAWLHRLLVNACYAEARSTKRWSGNVRVLTLNGGLAVEPAAEADISRQVAERDQLDRGFRRLPPDQRAVVVFHYYLGLTLAEIGQQLDIPLGTVKSRMHAATGALRAALEADARTANGAERSA
jgi:RNA polymerase sigma-70 factor (ECF subfamily)